MNVNTTIHPSGTVLILLMIAPWGLVVAEFAVDAVSPEATVVLAIGAGVINVCTIALWIASRIENGFRLIAQTAETTGRLHREAMQEHAQILGSSILNPVNLLATGFRGKAIADHDIARERERRRTDAAFDEMDTGPFRAFRG